MELSTLVEERIRFGGPISFRDFMDWCLYHPQFGYYMSDRTRIGKSGDFLTTPSLTPLLGALIAVQLHEMWEIMGRPRFKVLEFGGADGLLCSHIMEHVKNYPEFFEQLSYHIVEKGLSSRQAKETNVNCQRLGSLEALEHFYGCVLGNEVVDNFPVHRVRMEKELMELFVDWRDGFVEIWKPASSELCNYLGELGICLPQGSMAEINLQAKDWLKSLAEKMTKGFLITLDYGYSSFDVQGRQMNPDTLACYHHHRVTNSPYILVGQQDITSHVNFSALKLWGRKYGLDFCGYTDQAHFMRGLGLNQLIHTIEKARNGNAINEPEKQIFLNSVLLGLGKKIKVLIQHKGLARPQLSGLHFTIPIC